MIENEEIRSFVKAMVEKIKAAYRPEKIILFGSAVHEGEVINDLDLLIIKRDVPFYGTDRIIELYRLCQW